MSRWLRPQLYHKRVFVGFIKLLEMTYWGSGCDFYLCPIPGESQDTLFKKHKAGFELAVPRAGRRRKQGNPGIFLINFPNWDETPLGSTDRHLGLLHGEVKCCMGALCFCWFCPLPCCQVTLSCERDFFPVWEGCGLITEKFSRESIYLRYL